MATVIYRDQLTINERKDVEKRHAPYHRFEEFWTGFSDYQHDCNRRCPWSDNSVAGQAWDRGTEAAMRLHWDRYSCMYARDDLDSRAMHSGLQAAIERMRANGTLPPRALRPAERRAAAVANDN